jgi:putative ABC transport system permease protein
MWVSWLSGDVYTETQKQALMAEINAESCVEAVTLNDEGFWLKFMNLSVFLEPNDENTVRVKWSATDSMFFKTYGIPILVGSSHLTANSEKGGNVVVNQAFLEKLDITDNPIGQVFYYQKNLPATIVGVCGNFESILDGLQPIVITLGNYVDNAGIITIRVNEVNKKTIEAIQEKMKPVYQNDVMPEILTYSDQISDMFRDIKMFRDKIILSSFFLWLITIMGILGYVNLEIRRRTKEIAIRKIHGSTVLEVIWKISRGLLFMALIAATVAIPLAYILGSRWQQEFALKTSLNWYLFVGAVFIVMLTIAICAALQTWRTARANPARAVKSE